MENSYSAGRNADPNANSKDICNLRETGATSAVPRIRASMRHVLPDCKIWGRGVCNSLSSLADATTQHHGITFL